MSPFASSMIHWAKAGTAIGKHDWTKTGPLVEAAKTLLLNKAKALVASGGNRPVLFCYGCDGTPIRLTATFASSFGGRCVTRKGGDGQELLIQRGYVLAKDRLGELTSAAVLRELSPLSAGKGSWYVLGAACSFFPHLRELGARSIIITSTCFDRALQSSMGRLMAQRQALYYEVKHGKENAYRGDALYEVLTDWFVTTGCCAHDAQNALKWGMVGCVPNSAEVLKGLYIGLESLRNGYSLLHSHLSRFVAKSLSFAGADHPSEDDMFTMWSDMGLEPGLAQELAEIGLLWPRGILWVRNSQQGKAGHQLRVKGCFSASYAAPHIHRGPLDHNWAMLSAPHRLSADRPECPHNSDQGRSGIQRLVYPWILGSCHSSCASLCDHRRLCLATCGCGSREHSH